MFCYTAKANTNITVPAEKTKEKYYTLEEQEGLSVEANRLLAHRCTGCIVNKQVRDAIGPGRPHVGMGILK